MSDFNGTISNVVTGTVSGTVVQCGDLNTSSIVFGDVGRVVEVDDVPDGSAIVITDGQVFINGDDVTA